MEKATTPEHNTATTRLNQNQMSVTDSSNSDEISLIDLILILWKGKYIIAACTVIATVLGVIYALTATEIFSTSTTFILKTKRSEEHTSELQSRPHLVCRLLLEKKKKKR